MSLKVIVDFLATKQENIMYLFVAAGIIASVMTFLCIVGAIIVWDEGGGKPENVALMKKRAIKYVITAFAMFTIVALLA